MYENNTKVRSLKDSTLRTVYNIFNVLDEVQKGIRDRSVLVNGKITVFPPLTQAQIEAEVFNTVNYAEYDGSYLGFRGVKNKYYGIKNPNHRLYGRNIIIGVVQDNQGKNVTYAVDFSAVAEKIKDKVCVYDNTHGYIRCGSKGLHNVITGFNMVHHVNGIRTDNYLYNLEPTSPYLNAQYRLDAKFAFPGIGLGKNVSYNKRSRQLFRFRSSSTNMFEDTGINNTTTRYDTNYSEYIIAVINKYLIDTHNLGKMVYMSDEQIIAMARFVVRYTALNAEYAYKLFNIVMMMNNLVGAYDSFHSHPDLNYRLVGIIKSDLLLQSSYQPEPNAGCEAIVEREFLKLAQKNGYIGNKDFYLKMNPYVKRDSGYNPKI